MELYDQIRKIAFVFFVATGLAHFLSGLFFVNGYYAPSSGLVNRVLFIPFVLSTITYALSNIKCALMESGKDSKTLNYTFISLASAAFVILLAIELLAVDSPAPLIPPQI